MAIVPKEIRENIARAKGYLIRDEVTRSMEAMGATIRLYSSSSSMKIHARNVSVLIQNFLDDLTFHPQMKYLLDPDNTGSPSRLIYSSGKEIALATVLDGLAKVLLQAADTKHTDAVTPKNRMQNLIATGEEHFKEGYIILGRAYFNRAAVEFGKEEGIYFDLARRLTELKEYSSAAAIYELAIRDFPRDRIGYVEGVDSYINALEYAKAENIYNKILKQFGGHAKTYGRMARLYLDWNKTDEAREFTIRALKMDSKQIDAIEVAQKLKALENAQKLKELNAIEEIRAIEEFTSIEELKALEVAKELKSIDIK